MEPCLKLLYVEDDADRREMVSTKLKEIGLLVIETDSCSEARHLLESEPDISIVFFDGRVRDGCTFEGLVQESILKYPSIKTVAASAGSQEELFAAGCKFRVCIIGMMSLSANALMAHFIQAGIL